MADDTKRRFALIPSPYGKRKAPHVPQSPSPSQRVMSDANQEALRWIGDVAYRVQYGPYAVRGMTIQNFLRTRQLAVMDLFEDVDDEIKAENVRMMGKVDMGEVPLEELREQEEYRDIRAELLEVAKIMNEGTTSEKWIQKFVGPEARKHLERAMRTTDPELSREAIRAAETVIEIESPKASRIKPKRSEIRFPADVAKSVAQLFRDEGVSMRELAREGKDDDPPAAG